MNHFFCSCIRIKYDFVAKFIHLRLRVAKSDSFFFKFFEKNCFHRFLSVLFVEREIISDFFYNRCAQPKNVDKTAKRSTTRKWFICLCHIWLCFLFNFVLYLLSKKHWSYTKLHPHWQQTYIKCLIRIYSMQKAKKAKWRVKAIFSKQHLAILSCGLCGVFAFDFKCEYMWNIRSNGAERTQQNRENQKQINIFPSKYWLNLGKHTTRRKIWHNKMKIKEIESKKNVEIEKE